MMWAETDSFGSLIKFELDVFQIMSNHIHGIIVSVGGNEQSYHRITEYIINDPIKWRKTNYARYDIDMLICRNPDHNIKINVRLQ